MPQFNIHWKGRPHRHLPRIRVASSPDGTVQSRSHAHFASQFAIKSQLGLALEKARQQQRSRPRRGKRSSCKSSTGRLFSRNANPDTHKVELGVSRRVAKPSGEENEGYRTPKTAAPGLRRPVHASKGLADDTVSLSVHPARSSPPDIPSLVNNVNEVSLSHRPQILQRSRTQDPRLSVKKKQRRTASILSRNRIFGPFPYLSTVSRRSIMSQRMNGKSASSKQTISASISCSELIDSGSMKAIVVDIPSRTSSQLRTLRRFGGELERYVVGQDAIRKAGFMNSSTSSSCLSTHTVTELLPYQAEFQAVGLAVTSAEQREYPNLKARHSVKYSKPQDSGDQDHGLGNKMEEKMDGRVDTLTSNSMHNESGTSIDIDTSSSGTIIAFTSLDEFPMPLGLVASPVPKRSVTKVLPWLRKTEAVSGSTRLVLTEDVVVAADERTQSDSIGGTSITTIIEFTPECSQSAIKHKEFDVAPTPRQTSAIKWIDMDHQPPGAVQGEKQSLGLSPGARNKGKGRATNSTTRPARKTLKDDATTRIFSNETASLRADPVFQDIVRRSTELSASPSLVKRDYQVAEMGVPVGSKLLRPVAKQATESLATGSVNQKVDGRNKFTPVENPKAITIGSGTTCIELNSASKPSMGNLRPSPVLLDQRKPAQIKETTSMTPSKHASLLSFSHEPSKPSLPPARSAPSAPSAPSASQSFVSIPKIDGKLQPTSFPDQYDYENASIFEQVLCKVVNNSQIPLDGLANVWDGQLGHKGEGDPVKREPRSASITPSSSTSKSCISDAPTTVFAVGNKIEPTVFSEEPKVTEDIVKGLQVAVAATCNEDVDVWITEVSGYRVRKFLAGLKAFEGLGVNPLVAEAVRTARKRSKEYGRRVKVQELTQMQDERKQQIKQSKGKDRELGSVAADKALQNEALTGKMLERRRMRADANIKDRAVAMGWRLRSVSAGC